MATTVRCPNCDETFPVEDYEGPRVECPSCGTRFDRGRDRPSSPPPLSARDRDHDRDFGSRPAVALEAGALPLLQRGALVQIGANFLYLLAVLTVMILVLREMDKTTRAGPSEKLTRLLAVTFVVGLVASWFLNVVAGACWAMAPTRGVSRALGVAVLVFAVLVLERSTQFMLVLTAPMMGDPGGPFDDPLNSRFGPAVMLTAYFVDVVRMIVLACYLASAAGDTGRSGARTAASILAIVTPVLLLGPIGLMTLVSVVDKVGPDMGPVLLLLMMAGALVTAIWTLATLFQLRGAWARLGRQTRDD